MTHSEGDIESGDGIVARVTDRHVQLWCEVMVHAVLNNDIIVEEFDVILVTVLSAQTT